MKSKLTIVLLLPCFFIAGAFFTWAYFGYKFEILKQSSIQTPYGKVNLNTVSEIVGFPFLHPEKYQIEFEHYNIIVYKAERVFQETYPVVKEVSFSDNAIHWNDGLNNYELKIQPLKDYQFNPFSPESPENALYSKKQQFPLSL
jgi:hypothetical protein